MWSRPLENWPAEKDTDLSDRFLRQRPCFSHLQK